MAQIVTITNPLTGQPTQVDQLEHTAQQIDDGIGFESTDYPGCYYRTVGGVVEWVNPPMQLGVEYRTTERYFGKPVYVKEYDCGTFPEVNTEKYVSLDISDLQYVVRYSATCRTKTLPYYNGNTTTLSQQVDVIGRASSVPKIRLHSGTGTITTEKAYVTVFYTKTTG